MKEIQLTRGYVALIDDDDFDRVNKHKWRSIIDKQLVYAASDINGKKTMLHRFILNAKRGVYYDHRDCNGLNNQKDNLRECTLSENRGNSRKFTVTGSKYKGVNRHKPWSAHIMKNGKSVCLGYFESEDEAGIAYNKAAIDIFGEFARINTIG